MAAPARRRTVCNGPDYLCRRFEKDLLASDVVRARVENVAEIGGKNVNQGDEYVGLRSCGVLQVGMSRRRLAKSLDRLVDWALASPANEIVERSLVGLIVNYQYGIQKLRGEAGEKCGELTYPVLVL